MQPRPGRSQPTLAPDPAPCIALRALLEGHRDDGLSFDLAWRISLGIAVQAAPPYERGEWLGVFSWSSAVWRCAYDNQPGGVLTGFRNLFSTWPEDEQRQDLEILA
jgi:hypothetical protein